MEEEINWSNRVELARILAVRFKESPWRIFKLINTVFDEIKKKLQKDGRIEIRGFGVFTVKIRKGRKFINPRNKVQFFVQDRKTVSFKPSKIFLKVLRNGK